MRYKIQDIRYRLQDTRSTFHVSRSFTLIEILIASALFTAIVVLTVGSFTDSLSFNSSAGQSRNVRESARTFMDFLTLQIRQSNASRINVATASSQIPGGPPVFNNVYSGTGYVLISGYDPGGLALLPSLSTGGTASAVIFPIPKDASGNTWMYVGQDPQGTATYGIWKALPQGSPPDLTQLSSRAAMNWVSAGQFLAADVAVLSMSFRGISPQGTIFDSSTGLVLGYSVPAQPYLTMTMQVAPVGDQSNVSSYQTSITSRDYTFAFPQCSKFTDPTVACN